MVAVPFIYFSILIYLLYQRNGKRYDIACYIFSIFAVSGFFSVIMVVLGMLPPKFGSYHVSFSATITYCGLITLCTTPFIKYSNIHIRDIKPVKQTKLLKIMAVFFFLFFILDTAMNFQVLYNILTGDFGAYRAAHYQGDDEVSWVANYPYLIRFVVQYLHFIVGCPWILTFLAFYVVLIQKLKYKYGLMYLIASMIGIEGNLLAAGRSDAIYWLISIGACFIFFSPYISKAQRKKIGIVIIPIILVIILTFIDATTSKFKSHEGVGGLDAGTTSLIAYTGQPLLFFCFFFDNFTCPIPSLEAIFPYTYYLLRIGHSGIVGLQNAISEKSYYDVGVFYTFIGQIAVTSNNIVAIVYCFCITFLSNAFVSRTHKRIISLRQAFFYMLFASVLFLGLFSHYYAIMTKTFSVIAFCMIFWKLQQNKL